MGEEMVKPTASKVLFKGNEVWGGEQGSTQKNKSIAIEEKALVRGGRKFALFFCLKTGKI